MSCEESPGTIDFVNCDAPALELALPDSIPADTAALNRAVNRSGSSGRIHSILIVKDGRLMIEQYFNAYSSSDSFPLRSATKSVISAMVGVATDRKWIGSVDDFLMDYFPEYISDTADVRKKSIRIHHLLTMQSGFQWTEGSDRLYGNYVQSAVATPMNSMPGEIFNYSSAVPHILSGLVSKASGQTSKDVARCFLFEPMKIQLNRWDEDSEGNVIGGTGLYLKSRDLARFAFLYLRHGCYDGRRLLSEEWVDATLTDHVGNPGYGYLWWYDGETEKRFYAWGYGGQMVYLVPSLDMAAIFTAEANVNATDAASTKALTLDILENDIIAAFQ